MIAKTEQEKDIKYYMTEYKNIEEYCKGNGLDIDDFKKWIKQGYSDDRFLEINYCYWLAGDAINGKYMPITKLSEINSLLWEEIRDSDFYDTIEMLS